MGSSSDDEHREIEVDEIEEENLVEDEKLLNDTKKGVEWNHKESKKKKRSYDPRYAVPTYEEKQMMRNADMNIETSLLEIEVSVWNVWLGNGPMGWFARSDFIKRMLGSRHSPDCRPRNLSNLSLSLTSVTAE